MCKQRALFIHGMRLVCQRSSSCRTRDVPRPLLMTSVDHPLIVIALFGFRPRLFSNSRPFRSAKLRRRLTRAIMRPRSGIRCDVAMIVQRQKRIPSNPRSHPRDSPIMSRKEVIAREEARAHGTRRDGSSIGAIEARYASLKRVVGRVSPQRRLPL